MKNRKTFLMSLALALFVGVLGITSVANVLADTASTSTDISNVVPSFTTHTAESWTQAYNGTATTDARASSSTTYPTNEGTDITFSATANDTNNDDYYLIVCESAGVTSGDMLAPSCTGTLVCVSGATTTDVEATCTKDSTGTASETVNWYSYVCDANTSGLCASASNTSQGGAQDEATAGNLAGSPFHVNHRPTYTLGIAAVDPDDTVTFTNSADADTDTNGTQDTVTIYICSGAADQGGVTTNFDFRAETCTDGTLLCFQTGVNPSSANATCDDDPTGAGIADVHTNIVASPTAHAIDYTVHTFLGDGHGFNSVSTSSYDFTVNDVAPTFVSYTTTGTAAPTAGSYDTLTRAVTYTDLNGDNDVTALDFAFFNASSAEGDANDATDACTADHNDCYRQDSINTITIGTSAPSAPTEGCYTSTRSTAGSGKTALGTDTSITVSCDSTIYFNSDASADWEVSATATDGTGTTNFADSNVNTNIVALSGIGVTEATISYGTVALSGTSTFGAGTTTTFENLGNQVIDVLASGDAMTSGANSIAAAQQHFEYSATDWTYGTGDDALLTSATAGGDNTAGCLNRDLQVRAVQGTGTEDEAIGWKIQIPSAQEAGSYTGTNTFAYTATCTGTLR